MFEITLLTVGKLKEKFYLSAAAKDRKKFPFFSAEGLTRRQNIIMLWNIDIPNTGMSKMKGWTDP